MGSILSLLGGIGLFLYGMRSMTTALRQLTSHRVRGALRGLTQTPLSGAVTGAVITALVQSSSAVVVMTIGLVGAGMMTFVQSIGVILGANVGTTITGWIVALIGLKLKLGLAAMGLMFLSMMLMVFARGTAQRAGLALAGFSLIFIGLDLMREATAGFGGWITPEVMPPDTLAGRALAVLIGAVVAVAIQSSSAGVATVLVLLAAGSVSFSQAAALVIGMDVGTTMTGLLVSLGGGQAMRRTGVAHLAYNMVTGSLAFAALPLVLPLILAANGQDPISGLVLFHTGFNLVGVLLFMPVVRPFARLIERLVPGRGGPLGEALDRRLLVDEGAALDAAHGAAQSLSGVLLRATAARISGGKPDAEEGAMVEAAMVDTEDFLTRINLPDGTPGPRLRYAALLHQFDHLHRLAHRVYGPRRLELLKGDPELARPARALAAACLRAAEGNLDAARMARLQRRISGRTRHLRQLVLLRDRATWVRPDDVFDLTDTLRWIDRTADHVARVLHYGEAAGAERPTPPASARPPIS